MKIAIISDIHANFEALLSLSQDLESSDNVICLGDIIGYYCQVNEVIDYLRDIHPICIRGNHDHYLLHSYSSEALPAVKSGIDFANSVITPENRKWLSNLSLIQKMDIDSHSFLLCHGSPWDPLHEYLYLQNPSLYKLQELNFEVIAFGHTHREFLFKSNEKIILNPGSVGQSRDPDTKSYACASILDTTTMELKRIHKKI